MSVLVYVRPTPGWDKLRFNLSTGTVELPPDSPVGLSSFGEGTWLLGPTDRAALDASTHYALRTTQSPITAVAFETDVPGAAEEALREAMARGADRAVLIKGAEDADSFVAVSVLAALVRRVSAEDAVDLVLLGAEAPNGAPDEVGPMLAEELGWTSAVGAPTLDAATPAVVSTMPDIAQPPGYADAGSVIAAYREKRIETLSLADIGLTGAGGGNGTPRVVVRSAALAGPPPNERLDGPLEESVAVLAQALLEIRY